MRDIKFRVWDKKRKEMLSVFRVDFDYGDGNPCVVICGVAIDGHCVSKPLLRTGFDGYEFELMQFTGLKDKNGVDIYEGDMSSDGGIIKWNIDSCLFVIEYEGIEIQDLVNTCEWFEINGTIYDEKEA